jgi:prepilin-type N-terminal cleavage/methylation domain-containing protein
MLQNRKGFTLIELLIVVVIIGILAAIAIPKFSATREKAYYSSMKADLRNLQTQQEIFYQSAPAAGQDIRYKYSLSTTDADLGFAPSSGVEVTIEADPDEETGYKATATHKALADKTNQYCIVYVGAATVADPAKATGVVACSGEK